MHHYGNDTLLHLQVHGEKVDTTRKAKRKRKRKASELLNKIRTVREFAMEISESEKRSAMDAYSVEVETQISSF